MRCDQIGLGGGCAMPMRAGSAIMRRQELPAKAEGREKSSVSKHFLGMRSKLVVLVASVIALGFAQSARAITINYSNLDETDIAFSGSGTFNITGVSQSDVYQFKITSVNDGVGDSVGLEGYITPGGPFTIGTISGSSIQTASVTGTATLHITDADDDDLTGTLVWEDITTLGGLGVLNITPMVNLTNIMYSGTNSDLTALAATGAAADGLTFQFTPPQTLTQLNGESISTSYSGTLTSSNSLNPTVPEPASISLVCLGATGLLTRRRRS
jgi:hypothetical protein